MNSMKKCNLIVAIIFFLIGGLISGLSLQYDIDPTQSDPGSGSWPLILGILLCICSVILLVTSLKDNKLLGIEVRLNSKGNFHVYQAIGYTIGFCAILYFGGMIIALLVFIPLLMILLGVKNKLKIGITSILIAISIYVIFGVVLNTPLPQPIFL